MAEGGGNRILVIEDEEAIRDRMVRILGFEGFEARGAANGISGVSMAHDFRPEVILCDVMMRESDGNEVLNLLRQHLDTEVIPIIMVSAATDRASIRFAMENGADDYLTKPFTTEELVAAIQAQVTKRARLERHYRDG